MVAALRNNRHSIGVEIDPEYCRMAAAYLKAEGPDLFLKAELIFERPDVKRACLAREDQTLYKIKPAKKKLG
jgi:modification methylase